MYDSVLTLLACRDLKVENLLLDDQLNVKLIGMYVCMYVFMYVCM
jgi:hypothetical protein